MSPETVFEVERIEALRLPYPAEGDGSAGQWSEVNAPDAPYAYWRTRTRHPADDVPLPIQGYDRVVRRSVSSPQRPSATPEQAP